MPLPFRKNRVPRAQAPCPVSTCMELLGGAWTPATIWNLQAGPRRFSELQHDMAPISAKVLSQRLKELEQKGVVRRDVMSTSPPSVEYSLTDLGKEFIPAIAAIAQVGAKLAQRHNWPAP